MNTRTKIAASSLLIAALAAASAPAFAHDRGAGKSAGGTGIARQHLGPMSSLVTAGTITLAQAQAVETAARTAMEAAKTSTFNAALTALVANGTITQAQADAAKAVATAGKRGPAELATWTDAQRTALHTWLDANRPDGAAIHKAAIAKLVTAGTITQAQADAITAAFAAAPAPGDRDGDRGGDRGRGHGRGPGHGPGEGRGPQGFAPAPSAPSSNA